MADKKIYEFPTLTEADDDDLLLVSSNNDTYNIKVETLKESVGVSIYNGLDKTVSGYALDAMQGKALNDTITLDEKYDKLLHENVPNTTQTITFDSSGNVSTIVHTNGSNVAVRTDAFTFGTDTITEVRTLNTGESLTIATNTTTLTTTVTYAA